MRPREQKWLTDKSGSWYVMQDRPLSGPVVPEPHGQVRQGEIDDTSRSLQKLRQTGDELIKLATLADEGAARNRRLEADLNAAKKLYQTVRRKAGDAFAAGSDFGPTHVVAKPEAQPLGGPGLMPSFIRDVLGEPDPKEEGLTTEQKHFLWNLNAARR